MSKDWPLQFYELEQDYIERGRQLAEAEGRYKKTFDLLCATMLVFKDMTEFMPETIPDNQIGTEMQERIDKLEKAYEVWENALEAAEAGDV